MADKPTEVATFLVVCERSYAEENDPCKDRNNKIQYNIAEREKITHKKHQLNYKVAASTNNQGWGG